MRFMPWSHDIEKALASEVTVGSRDDLVAHLKKTQRGKGLDFNRMGITPFAQEIDERVNWPETYVVVVYSTKTQKSEKVGFLDGTFFDESRARIE